MVADSKPLADGSRWVKYGITDLDGCKVGFTTLLFSWIVVLVRVQRACVSSKCREWMIEKKIVASSD